MTLIDDWRRILKRAWSVRFAVLAGIFSAAEAILPLYSDAIPRNLFAVLSLVAALGAVLARVVPQKGMRNEP